MKIYQAVINFKASTNLVIFISVLLFFSLLITSCNSGSTPVIPDPKFIEDVEELEELIVVYDTPLSEVIENLNSARNRVTVKLDNGQVGTAQVFWDDDIEKYDYHRDIAGSYRFKGLVKYNELIAKIYIDIWVQAYFEISNLQVDPNPILREQYATLSFHVENKSDVACQQDIVLQVLNGDEALLTDIMRVSVKAREKIEISESQKMPYYTPTGDYTLLVSSNNDSQSLEITVK